MKLVMMMVIMMVIMMMMVVIMLVIMMRMMVMNRIMKGCRLAWAEAVDQSVSVLWRKLIVCSCRC